MAADKLRSSTVQAPRAAMTSPTIQSRLPTMTRPRVEGKEARMGAHVTTLPCETLPPLEPSYMPGASAHFVRVALVRRAARGHRDPRADSARAARDRPSP